MANSIIGAFYIGLFTATVSPAAGAEGSVAQVVPQPQCVMCGSAERRRVARVYDWSNGRIKAQREPARGYSTHFSIDDLLRSHRLDMTSRQVERMAHFSGV